MISTRHKLIQPKQNSKRLATAFLRSPYRERTHVVRVPESMLPTVKRMLAQCRQDVADSAWLGKAG